MTTRFKRTLVVLAAMYCLAMLAATAEWFWPAPQPPEEEHVALPDRRWTDD